MAEDMIDRAVKALEPYLERGSERLIATEVLTAALDPEDEEMAWLAAKALYNSAADRAGRHRPDLDMRPFEQQSDDMQRAWKQDGAAVIAALKAAAQGEQPVRSDKGLQD